LISEDTEEWRDVPSLSGLTASSWGRIKLPESVARMPNGGLRRYTTKPTYGVVTKASKTAQHTYLGTMNRRLGNIKVHRAVFEAFHGPPPEADSVVIHINEDAHDNRPCNLRWGTQKENLNCPGFLKYAAETCRERMRGESPKL